MSLSPLFTQLEKLLTGPSDPSKGAYVDWARHCALALSIEEVAALSKLVVATLYGYTFLPPTLETLGVADQAQNVLDKDGTLDDLVAEIVAITPAKPLDTLRDKQDG